MNKDLTVLLVEDNKIECEIFKEYFYTRDGVKLIATVNSSDEALNIVKTHSPDGVILDMELNYGKGSGYKFLKDMSNLKSDNKPVIIVTTKLDSKIAYENIHSYGVPIIFYKNKPDYCPELILNTLVELVNTVRTIKDTDNENIQEIDTEEMKKKRIENKISQELDAIGISDNLKGKKYLFEAIYYIVENELEELECSAVKSLENKYQKTHSNMICVMQTAIHHAWRKSTIETLEKQYKAVVRHHTGVPTVNEFIYYYANKIYKQFK